MAVIKIRAPGGLLPSVSPRALPDQAAQTAENLHARVPEFRPLAVDSDVAVSGVTNPKTLHRLSRTAAGALNDDVSTGWIVDARELSFVKGQLDDNATDRTYYTFNDGLNPPRAIDALGADRQLGVPAPTTAPALVVTTVDEFTPDERAGAEVDIVNYLEGLIRGLQDAVWIGADHPGTVTTGWADRGSVNGEDEYGADQWRLFKLTSTGGANNGTISNTYGTMPADQAGWVLNLEGAFIEADVTSPAWTGNAGDHWLVAVPSYGRGYETGAGTEAALLAATMPGTGLNGGTAEPLMTSGQVTALLADVNDLLDPTNAVLAPLVEAVKKQHANVALLFNGHADAAMKAQVTKFYTDIGDAVIDSAIATFAEAMYQAATLVATAGDTTYYTGAGA